MVQGNGPRARQRYRVADRDRVNEAVGYMLARVSGLAAGEEYPLVLSVKEARKWAQTLLDEMVAEGHIEPRCPGEQAVQIGNRRTQTAHCNQAEGHRGSHTDLVLDSDDNWIKHSWPAS